MKRTYLGFAFAWAALSTPAWAHGDQELVTDFGRNLSISYYELGAEGELLEATAFTTAIEVVEFCGDGVELLKDVTLWMPEHGHGSLPTTIEQIEETGECVMVSDVYFSMPGRWTLSLSFSDDDFGVAEVHIHGVGGHNH